MPDDRRGLVDVLERVVEAYEVKTRGKTLLSRDAPDAETLAPFITAIEGLPEYQAVAGLRAYALNTVAVVDAGLLARIAVNRAEWKSSSEAVDWLFRFLETRTTTVLLKAAIWGISIDDEIQFSKSARLLQFDRLPSSYTKGSILERKKWHYGQFVWYSDHNFDVPLVAYSEEIHDVPFLSDMISDSDRVDTAIRTAIETCRLIEAACVGHPIPMAYWLEFQDAELDLAFTGNLLTWSLPEVRPRVDTVTKLDPGPVVSDYECYGKLDAKWKADLRRSMDRFTLSQCRRELIDRVLDLALAFEIAVSQKGDNVPPRWKVSVRAAQLLGGSVEDRVTIRRTVGRLYELRNKATHGSTLVSAERDVVLECAKVYPLLLQRLLRCPDRPNWGSIELESPKSMGPK